LIIISACLLGLRCRYDGKRLKLKIKLPEAVRGLVQAVCPEQLGGLPTPRPKVIINEKGRAISEKGEDVTKNFLIGAREVLKIAKILDAKKAYLKSNSPSCGYHGITAQKLKSAGIKVFWVD
jgi:uncharacterized protein YbbK (DUF523 family)